MRAMRIMTQVVKIHSKSKNIWLWSVYHTL